MDVATTTEKKAIFGSPSSEDIKVFSSGRWRTPNITLKMGYTHASMMKFGIVITNPGDRLPVFKALIRVDLDTIPLFVYLLGSSCNPECDAQSRFFVY